ncbi:MAG: DUF1648 domain-containing protein [Candidatus Metalachnospira sp.]|nr:DUF1648 domain-containing protein [Candidatus Metalachnospira sp.]
MMKKINMKILIITGLVCLVPIIFGLYYYNELPNQIAVHFNYNNVPDNYAPKFFAVFGIPFFLLLLQIFMCVVNDLSEKNRDANRKITMVSKWIIPIISVVINITVIRFSLGKTSNINKPVCIILGIVFVILGNYLPKTKQNSIIGVRTKYTLSSEEIWQKSARVTGYIMIIFGVMFIVSAFLDTMIAVATLIAFVVAMLIVSFVYPYRLAKKSGVDRRK